jgi:hypothetical protein
MQRTKPILESSIRSSLEVQVREERLQKALFERYLVEKEESARIHREITVNLTEMDSLISFLVPAALGLLKNLEIPKVNPQYLCQSKEKLDEKIVVEISSSNPLQIVENGENSVIFEALRSCYSLMTTKQMPRIQRWIDTLTKLRLQENYENEESVSKKNEQLQVALDLRNRMQTVDAMCRDLGIRTDEEEMTEIPLLSPNNYADIRSSDHRLTEQPELSGKGKEKRIDSPLSHPQQWSSYIILSWQ